MQRPVRPSFGRVKIIVDGWKYGWTGKKIKEQKKVSQNHRYCQLCLKSECKKPVNGVTCMCVCSLF